MSQKGLFPIYYSNRSSQGKPADWQSYEVIKVLLEEGLAEWTSKKCKAVRLKRTEAELKTSGLSAKMPAWLGQKAVEEGDPYCLACVNAWA